MAKRKPVPMKYLNHPRNLRLTLIVCGIIAIGAFILLHVVMGIG